MAKIKPIEKGEINLHLNEINSAYSKFSDFENDNLMLDESFINYVQESAKENHKKDVFEIKINIDNKPEQSNCDKLNEVFKNHYKHELEENVKDLKRLNIIALSLLTIGIIIIVILHFLSLISVPYIVTTVLEICAWVFVWEFVDTFFFKKFGYKIKKMFYNKLMNSNIVLY